jgi:hypothetical protein
MRTGLEPEALGPPTMRLAQHRREVRARASFGVTPGGEPSLALRREGATWGRRALLVSRARPLLAMAVDGVTWAAVMPPRKAPT